MTPTPAPGGALPRHATACYCQRNKHILSSINCGALCCTMHRTEARCRSSLQVANHCIFLEAYLHHYELGLKNVKLWVNSLAILHTVHIYISAEHPTYIQTPKLSALINLSIFLTGSTCVDCIKQAQNTIVISRPLAPTCYWHSFYEVACNPTSHLAYGVMGALQL